MSAQVRGIAALVMFLAFNYSVGAVYPIASGPLLRQLQRGHWNGYNLYVVFVAEGHDHLFFAREEQRRMEDVPGATAEAGNGIRELREDLGVAGNVARRGIARDLEDAEVLIDLVHDEVVIALWRD